MNSELAAMFDPSALAIVTAGTVLATLARCGWHDLRAALAAVLRLWGPRFDSAANRAALARSVREIGRTGPLCAEGQHPPDRALAQMLAAYLRTGTQDALASASRAHRATREIARLQAVRTLEYASEVAPIFGLVGTLYAINQLAPVAGASMAETTMAAMATAVLSSLYGVLLAHLVCIPLASAIDRRAGHEDEAREALVEWFEAQVASRGPTPIPPSHIRKVA